MCATCGCGATDVRVDGRPAADVHPHEPPQEHPHEHPHEHAHPGGHVHERLSGVVEIETALLAKNDHLAGHNRAWLAERRIATLNLMSSPGSGKTSLLCRTIAEVAPTRPVAVVEGDQETRIDAERIRATGAPVVQINTGSGCHLDAAMLARGLAELAPAPGSLVFVENVGNLVCPALFDLGERRKVVVISVTEGDDKPLKYPHMFAAADLVVVNKTDLLPYVDFDVDRCRADLRSLNPRAAVLALSARTGEGMPAWRKWLDAVSPQEPRTPSGMSRIP